MQGGREPSEKRSAKVKRRNRGEKCRIGQVRVQIRHVKDKGIPRGGEGDRQRDGRKRGPTTTGPVRLGQRTRGGREGLRELKEYKGTD